MDFVWAGAFHIKPIDVNVLLMTYILLSFTMGFLRISHCPIDLPQHPLWEWYGSAPYQTETHHYVNATYFEPFLSNPILSKPTATDMGLLWATEHYSIPISPKHTAADMGLLQVENHHTIPILSKHTAADKEILLQVSKHHITPISSTGVCSLFYIRLTPEQLSAAC